MYNKKEIVLRYFWVLSGWVITVFISRYIFSKLGTDILSNTNVEEVYFDQYYHSFLLITCLTYPAIQFAFSNIILSCVGSIIFAYIPYQIYSNYDNCFWRYSLVPIVTVLMLSFFINSNNKKNDRIKMIIFQIAMIVMTIKSVDYAIIILEIFIVVSIYSLFNQNTNSSVFIISSIILIIGVCTSIYFGSGLHMGGNERSIDSSLQQIELHSLVFWKMLMPVHGHRINKLAILTNDLCAATGLELTDSYANALGGVGTVGFIISICIVLGTYKKKDEMIRVCGAIELVLLLLFNSVGINIILQYLRISYISYYIKCIPIINFLSILVLLRSIQIIYLKFKANNLLLANISLAMGSIMIIIFAVLDQIPRGEV